MTFDKAVEGAVKRDRLVVVVALGFIVALSWIYLLAGAGMNISASEMTRSNSGDDSMGMMMPAVWDLDYAGLMFVMWWVMMIAMMLPSATPMVLLFATINRKQKEGGRKD